MKNRKFLILIIVNIGVIIGLIVAGFLLYSKYLKIVVPPLPSPFLVPGYTIDPEVLLVQFESCLAGKEDPPLNPEASWSDTFYTIVRALSQRNEESCLKLEKEGKNDCLRYFYFFKALTKNDVNYCQKLKPLESSDNYLLCLTLAKNDKNFCQQIKNSLNQEICLAIFEPDRCNHLSGTFDASGIELQVESYGVKGSRTKRERNEIGAEEARAICRKNIYFLEAIKEKNPAICNLPEFKRDSFTMLICQILSTPEPEKEWQSLRQKICYEKLGPTIALLKNDPSICEKIPFKDAHNRDLYNSCLAQIK